MSELSIDEKAKRFLVSRMLKVGRAVGSQVWGGATAKSDHDYLIPHKDLEKELIELEFLFPESWAKRAIFQDSSNASCNLEESLTFRSLITESEGKTYNFISPFDDNSLQVWNRAASFFDGIAGSEILLDKYSRVALFETVKGIYSSILLREQEEALNLLF